MVSVKYLQITHLWRTLRSVEV